MLIDELSRRVLGCNDMQPVMAKLGAGEDAALGIVASVRPFIIAALYARNTRPMLVVVSGNETAESFAHGVATYIGRRNVAVFPERADMPWGDTPAKLSVVGARTKAMCMLAAGKPVVVVASARALMRKVAPAGSNVFAPIVCASGGEAVDARTGEVLEYEGFAAALVERGYQRLDAIDAPGTFSVRGDTIDVFCAGDTSPVRIEFFGDEVDGLRQVVASTGQTIRELDAVHIWPAREFAISKRGRERLVRELEGMAQRSSRAAEQASYLRDGIYFAGIERYLPLLYKRLDMPLAHASRDTLIVLAEPRTLFDDAARRYDELKQAAGSAHVQPDELNALFCAPAKMDFGAQQRLTLLSIMRAGGVVDADLGVERPSVAGREEKFFGLLHELVNEHNIAVFAASSRNVREEFETRFTDNHLPFVERFNASEEGLSNTYLNVTDVDIANGFIIPAAKLGVVSVGDLAARGSRRRTHRHIDITEVTFPYQPGDYVVHASHGIALFAGMVRQEVGGAERDYLLLKYAAEDKLYVPVEQIDRVTRYVGPDGSAPRLTRLDSADWTRATAKARKSAKKLAFDLVDLYARRSTVKGFSYSPDSVFQEEMEQIFPYEETPDQLKAIADVKADMESERPMDRLICGDVGFGKTEVACRAAFKAVADHRQVMFLCPTTILAQQHYTTFNDRFEPFGIRVEVLSRFRTPAQQKAALAGFADGEVDVLVGTHRLLSRDVNPKNLGLVVIDEEQRFGVQHKEQLKNLRESVDVLTLTATPIPRTLQMSLSGVRDMSLITTPPPNRRPVKVHVGEWDEDVVSGAIRRELERGGQVYYVSNRVRTIDLALERVQQAAPEARVGVAHGQMSAKAVEAVMEQFNAGEIDVLISTTIVESGIDNPHSNTLIIEDSQRLGLAQLYQLKGRVGRSKVQAYAFFLFPHDGRLTEEAAARLEAIGEFTELGSGMKVAMRDLEIRGAGSMLGAEQSGQVSAVGFDLFASMLAEAVANARGEEQVAHQDIRVDVNADFFLPEELIPAADERVAYYRKLACAEFAEDVEAIRSAMRETYGALPQPAVNMCDRARIKALAAEVGITSVSQVGGKVVIEPVAKQVETQVHANREAQKALNKLHAIYVPRANKYTVPCATGEPALQIALTAIEAVYSSLAQS